MHEEKIAMDELEKIGLENVTNSAYVLHPSFTPSASAMVIDLPTHVGQQLRVMFSGIALETVAFGAPDDAIRRAARRATRVMMQNVYSIARKWLEAHPETEGG